MKNAIIAITTLFCGYFLLQALGAFNFGSFIDREERGHYAALRAKAVNAAPEYKLGAVYNDGDWADVEAMRGVRLAVNMLNGQGSGKAYRLVANSTAHTKIYNNAAIQALADAPDTVAVIAPFESEHIPSSRSLTQFYALPLLSPLAAVSEKLPDLEPDNFVTVFPPLEFWVNAVLDHMEKHGVANLFILSPGPGTYGDIFCTELERGSRGRQGFDQVFRLNYQQPLRRQNMERLLRSHVGNQKFEAVFFGGGFADFNEFASVFKDNRISLPVYGSDDLYAPEVLASPETFSLYLPRAVRKNDDPEFARQWRELYGSGPGYHARFGAEIVFLLDKALKEAGTYDAQSIVDSMRRSIRADQDNPETAPRIVIDAIPGANLPVP